MKMKIDLFTCPNWISFQVEWQDNNCLLTTSDLKSIRFLCNFINIMRTWWVHLKQRQSSYLQKSNQILSMLSNGKESNISAKIAPLLATNAERLHNCQGYHPPNLNWDTCCCETNRNTNNICGRNTLSHLPNQKNVVTVHDRKNRLH